MTFSAHLCVSELLLARFNREIASLVRLSLILPRACICFVCAFDRPLLILPRACTCFI